jgi:hypothetical protein
MSHPPTPPMEEASERWNYVQKPERELQQVIAPAIREAMEAREPDEIICQIEADQNFTREQTDFLVDIRRVSLIMLCWEEFLRKDPLFRGSRKFPQDFDPTQRVRKWARAKVIRFLGDSSKSARPHMNESILHIFNASTSSQFPLRCFLTCSCSSITFRKRKSRSQLSRLLWVNRRRTNRSSEDTSW